MKRTCKKCGDEKDIEEFVINKQCKYGYAHTCKKCENKNKRTEKSRLYDRNRQENKLVVCIQCKQCKIFYMDTKQHAKNGSKYCSRYCMALAMKGIKRPGHVMEIMKKTWIKKGQRISPETEFKKGSVVIKKYPFLKSPERKKHLIKYTCDFCGNIFEDYPYRGSKRENCYCNVECMSKAYFKGGAQATRDELRDSYIKTCIQQGKINIKRKDVTPEMIELKRESIEFNRLTKELENVINCR